MATYVPGSEQYLPDIKPFTPDYKFLSAVLDTRQDKYNTNWQATNDVYNKVVDLSLNGIKVVEKIKPLLCFISSLALFLFIVCIVLLFSY